MDAPPIGVVPAAGHALRLRPLSSSKELLTVGGRPVMDHLLQRLRVAGADRIRIVIRPAKVDLIEAARARALEIVLAEPPTVTASVRTGAAGLPPEAIALIGFADSVWEPVDAFRTLAALVHDGASVAVGAFRSDEPERSDVVDLDDAGRLRGVRIKPAHPGSSWIWGCFAIRARVLATLGADEELGAFLARQAAEREVSAVRFGRILDIGTPSALAGAADDPLVSGAP
jgi:dTDP-glucose pyrophosphorylase